MLTSKSCNSSRDNKELCSWPSLGVLANFVNDSLNTGREGFLPRARLVFVHALAQTSDARLMLVALSKSFPSWRHFSVSPQPATYSLEYCFLFHMRVNNVDTNLLDLQLPV